MILRPLTSEYDDPSFGPRRRLAVRAMLLVGAVFGTVHGIVAAQQLFAAEAGIPAAKILIAAVIGLTSGLALWAVVAMLTVSFAPEAWLRLSPKGQQWMRRSGLRLDNTAALRVVSFHIGVVAAAYSLFNLYAIIVWLKR